MMNGPIRRYTGALVISLIFIAVGLITLYDTMHYADVDSKIFPRAAAIMLILAAGASRIISITRPAIADGFGKGSWWRRILLVGSMLAAALAMPWIGFLPAAVLISAGGLVSGMHDPWNGRILFLYAAFSTAIATAFYSLFKYALYVPLP